MVWVVDADLAGGGAIDPAAARSSGDVTNAGRGFSGTTVIYGPYAWPLCVVVCVSSVRPAAGGVPPCCTLNSSICLRSSLRFETATLILASSVDSTNWGMIIEARMAMMTTTMSVMPRWGRHRHNVRQWLIIAALRVPWQRIRFARHDGYSVAAHGVYLHYGSR